MDLYPNYKYNIDLPNRQIFSAQQKAGPSKALEPALCRILCGALGLQHNRDRIEQDQYIQGQGAALDVQ